MSNDKVLLVTFFVAILGSAYAAFNFTRVNSLDEGSKEMQDIASAIRIGANTFLKSEYKVLTLVVVALALLQAIFIFVPSAVAFLIGASMSALAGFFGMKAATIANVRVTNTAQTKSIGKTLKVALRGGSVMGLCVGSFSLIGLLAVYFLFRSYLSNLDTVVNWCGFSFTPISMIFSSYALGCSMIAMFNRVGGGIYTKAADMGADLVGKTEENIPEDDPRNPAVIADCVGDNVGDTAGLGSDLLESTVGSIVSSIITPIFIISAYQAKGLEFSGSLLHKLITYPIGLMGIGLLSCMISLIFVLSKKGGKHPRRELNMATWISAGLTALLSLIFTLFIFIGEDLGDLPFALGAFSPWISSFVGIIGGITIGWIAEYYTSDDFSPTRKIVDASKTGPALNITEGLSISTESIFPCCLVMGLVIFISSCISGIYGISMAAVGMLSFVAVTVSVDTYGPISDNAGGIAEMAHLNPKVRRTTDRLDSIGNTTAAVGKGFAIGSAALTSISLFISYIYSYTPIESEALLNIIDPQICFGALVGGSLIYFLSGMLIEAVSKSAEKMVNEVRRQFRTIVGLREGETKPDYESCIKIATQGALSGMKAPALISVCAPIIGGFLFGPNFVGGLLFGAIITATFLAIFFGNAGGAWDNAKKSIEASGLKGTPEHKASVVGDTVGDPLKDTSGPSLNIFIKIMSTTALIAVCFFKDFHIF